MRAKLSKGLLTVLLVLGLLLQGMPVSVASSPFAGGDGSAANPFRIENWHHLNNVRGHLTSHFILMNDLDSTTAGFAELASSTADAGRGWLPIGTDALRFTGNFNGQGHEIRDLFINRPGTDVRNTGLFGIVGGAGVVRNVSVVNVNVTGFGRVGGLVGYNLGTVSHSSASGSVSGSWGIGGLVGFNYPGSTITNSSANSNVTGHAHVGGLVGRNYGTVSNSYASGSVSGTNEVGGLAGVNVLAASTVSGSHASGSVTGTNMVGGLVGLHHAGTVTNSYATGNVTGKNGGFRVGGLVGSNGGAVSNSYATGSVSGPSEVGGLVGHSTGAVTASFWNTETSGQTGSAGGPGAMGRTTVEIRTLTTFQGAGWNITTVADGGARNSAYIWNIVNGVTYPFFNWQPVVRYNLTTAIAPAGGGTATDLTGTSPYPAGTVVHIQAVPAAGFEFVNWTATPAGTFGSPTAATTTFTMPAENVTVTANFVAAYTLTMAVAPAGGGTATDLTGTSPYPAGTVVNIQAVPAAGFRFVNWTATPAGIFGSSTSAATTFTMPAQGVAITANFVALFAGGYETAAAGLAGAWLYEAVVLPCQNIGAVFNVGGAIMYGKLDIAANRWTAVNLGTNVRDASLALDAAGRPHIVFVNADHGLVYRYFDGSSWTAGTTIDSRNVHGTGRLFSPDIAVDAAGTAHIAFIDTHGAHGPILYRGPFEPDLMYANNLTGTFAVTLIGKGTFRVSHLGHLIVKDEFYFLRHQKYRWRQTNLLSA
jgi:hypothetical protein